ncbi:MAG: hypothetical protein NVS2B17_18260 [Candidatus Velthaea sp.]
MNASSRTSANAAIAHTTTIATAPARAMGAATTIASAMPISAPATVNAKANFPIVAVFISVLSVVVAIY